MKILKVVGISMVILLCIAIIFLYDANRWISISCIIISVSLPVTWRFIQDLNDKTDWETSQTQLLRGGFIRDTTIIRISFAYLFRIKVGNKYLLVQNSRNTGKYQPVGGVYKLQGNEKQELKKRFHVMDDDKIPIDESSRDDYRLRMENQYLRKFVERFNSYESTRERINNVGREFREELKETGIVDWSEISYRYCGRHMTELKFVEHFQIYELLLSDIVEFIPSLEQEQDLKKLQKMENEKYRFVTAEQIKCLGMDIDGEYLYEWIGDHTKQILQENEGKLIALPGTGDTYSVVL